jgi:predicted metal-dependent peptidase
MRNEVLHLATIAKKSSKEEKAMRLTDKPIPKDLAKRVETKIIKARVKMLFQQPFFGTLVTRLQIFAADKWLPTMAVDGKYMYFNHAFVDALELDELVFVFAHEILHMVYGHLDRGKGLDQQLYNCAADYVVNDELKQVNVGTFPTTVPGLHDIKYRGWNSEKVYEDLLKQQKNNPNSGKSLEEMIDKMLDEHLTGKSVSSENEGPSSGTSKPSPDGPAKMSEEDRKQLKADLKQQIISSAQMVGIGKLPSGVQRLVNELLAPKMDWKTLLQSQLNSIVPADYSFLRVNRKGWHLDAILPGMTEEPMLNIAVALDMSGSISNEMVQEFLSEIKGIMDQYPMYEIRVFCFDTRCYSDRTFSSDNGEDIRTYEAKGGGGTDGGAIFRYMKDENFIPLKLVVFTDGYVGDFGDENYCPTVWVIKGSNVVPPFGTHAYFDDEN